MKRLVGPIIFILLIVGVFWYVKNHNKIAPDSSIKTYRNSNLGISFSYPKILTASSTADIITLHHEVPFIHHDYCDFKGDGTEIIPVMTDFNATFEISNKNLIDTMKKESPYIPEENFVNGEVVAAPGFIDAFETPKLKGFKIFEGAEGCGKTVYYLSISQNKTLIIKREFITVMSGVINIENQAAAETVQGVLNKEKEEEVFDGVIQTLEAK